MNNTSIQDKRGRKYQVCFVSTRVHWECGLQSVDFLLGILMDLDVSHPNMFFHKEWVSSLNHVLMVLMDPNGIMWELSHCSQRGGSTPPQTRGWRGEHLDSSCVLFCNQHPNKIDSISWYLFMSMYVYFQTLCLWYHKQLLMISSMPICLFKMNRSSTRPGFLKRTHQFSGSSPQEPVPAQLADAGALVHRTRGRDDGDLAKCGYALATLSRVSHERSKQIYMIYVDLPHCQLNPLEIPTLEMWNSRNDLPKSSKMRHPGQGWAGWAQGTHRQVVGTNPVSFHHLQDSSNDPWQMGAPQAMSLLAASPK